MKTFYKRSSYFKSDNIIYKMALDIIHENVNSTTRLFYAFLFNTTVYTHRIANLICDEIKEMS